MKKQNFESLCVKEFDRNINTKPHQLPIYATSSFVFDSLDHGIDIFSGITEGHSYSRYSNPTIDTVANKIGAMEAFGTELDTYSYLTSSGMSAISTLILGTLTAGDVLLTQSNLYGGTTVLFQQLLSGLGIETKFIDFKNLDEIESHLQADNRIKMIYMESPANPTMSCIDIRSISALAKSSNILTAIDNTFCTPYLQNPLGMGVDFVIHSTTKYLNGHGNSIAGVIIGHRPDYKQKIWSVLKLIGTNSNAWDAWLLNNGLKTLAVRMDKHCSNAQKLAEYLASHSAVSKVNYNGLESNEDHTLAKSQMTKFGGMLSFEIKEGMKGAIGFMNSLEFCTLAPTLGDVDTLILHPATSSHINVPQEQRIENGVTDGLIRVSVGIESIEDIMEDVQKSLKNV